MQLLFSILLITFDIASAQIGGCLNGTERNAIVTVFGPPPEGNVYYCSVTFTRSTQPRCYLSELSFYLLEGIYDPNAMGCGYFHSDASILCICSKNECNRDVLQFHAYLQASAESTNASEATLARCVIENVLPAYENPTRLPETIILTSSESSSTTTTTTTGVSTPAPSTPRRSSTTPPTSSTASSSEAGKVSTRGKTTTSSFVPPTPNTPKGEASTTTERDANSPDALTASTNTTETTSPSSPHHCEAVNNSIWSAWFISSLIVNGLQFVAILSLVYVVVKKGSVTGKNDKKKTNQPTKISKPTS